MSIRIKTKIVVAYEPQSSGTFRIHPKDLGITLMNIPDGLLHHMITAAKEESIYLPKEHRRKLAQQLSILSTYIARTIDKEKP